MSKTYDAIVIGLGGVGSSAVFSLAKQGVRVLGLDQFSPPHDRGSSHGETRIIRKSYFEHPSYVPLVCRAYDLWRELECLARRQLYFPTGILEIGPADGIVIPGVLKSAAQFNLPIEQFSMAEAMRRYPALRGDPAWSVILEQDAGYLLVEQCVQAHLDEASAMGAEWMTNQCVVGWQPDGKGVSVQTENERYIAGRLILAAGPWSSKLLYELNVPLRVLHKHLYWFDANNGSYRQADGFPCFFFETPQGHFYGFPQRDSLGVKVARHSGGEPVLSDVNGHHDRSHEEEAAVRDFLDHHLPNVRQRLNRWSGCYYTMTPDENFIVDTLPACQQVCVVAGLSGHGFKFTSVLGELAADMAMDRPLSADLSFLRLSRFS